MAQRRNSSGRGDERSDLTDVKALAAKARETGGPVLKQDPAEISGVRPRRDSVIGMRLTPPPRATSSELPNWFWGVLGCLSVLLVGFAGLVLLGRSGTLVPLLGVVSPLAAPAAPSSPPAAPASVAGTPVAAAPTEPPPPASPAKAPAARTERAERAEHEHIAVAEQAAPAVAAAPAASPTDPTAAPPEAAPAVPTVPAVDDGAGAAKRAARDHAAAPSTAKGRVAKAGESAAADDQDTGGGDTPEAKAAARPAAKAPAKADTDDSDDDSSLPGQDAVEAALDKLASQVRGCFVKYQIKGTARVRLVATPAGTAESVNVTGDFEDTPTGLCVEAVIGAAKLPTFNGPSLKLSQSYQLR
jgi:hypothetical protein